MDPIQIQYSSIDTECLLLSLISELNKNPREDDIVELLNQFPSHEVALPELNLSPRRVIEHMKKRHVCTRRGIEKEKPVLGKYIVYHYLDPYTSKINSFTFTNNMSLAADIFIICYLYRIQIRSEPFALKEINYLYSMMAEKYHIQHDCMNYSDGYKITGFNIAHSFPSVSFRWFAYVPDALKSLTSNITDVMFTTFPGLSNQLWSPLIASIIPRLHESKFPPIVLLTAINVKNNQIIKDSLGDSNDLSLNTIFKGIRALYCSKIFPKSLKLKLCEKWGIVKKIGVNKYEYADYFTNDEYLGEAKKLIRELKSRDPDYSSTISQILYWGKE